MIYEELSKSLKSLFIGEFYFDDQNDHKSKPYNIFNASIGYKKDNIEINLWGKNIFNTNYAIRGYTFALDPTYEVRDWKSYGNKRTIGFSIIVKV